MNGDALYQPLVHEHWIGRQKYPRPFGLVDVSTFRVTAACEPDIERRQISFFFYQITIYYEVMPR